jgi:hypothetical protein
MERVITVHFPEQELVRLYDLIWSFETEDPVVFDELSKALFIINEALPNE